MDILRRLLSSRSPWPSVEGQPRRGPSREPKCHRQAAVSRQICKILRREALTFRSSNRCTMFELMNGSSACTYLHPKRHPTRSKAEQSRPSLPQRIHNQRTQKQPNRDPNSNLYHRVSNIKHNRVELGLFLSDLKKLAVSMSIPFLLQVTIK